MRVSVSYLYQIFLQFGKGFVDDVFDLHRQHQHVQDHEQPREERKRKNEPVAEFTRVRRHLCAIESDALYISFCARFNYCVNYCVDEGAYTLVSRQ